MTSATHRPAVQALVVQQVLLKDRLLTGQLLLGHLLQTHAAFYNLSLKHSTSNFNSGQIM